MSDARGPSAKGESAKAGPRRGVGQSQFEQKQIERERAKAEQARQRQVRRNTLVAGVIVAILLVAGGIAVWTMNQNASNVSGVVTYSNLSRTHVNVPVTYAQIPPVGGQHWPIWLNCGMYTQPVTNENAVHSLEHGAVWITYQPNLPATELAQLKTLLSSHSYFVLSPYSGLPSPIVASAWGVQLKVQSVTDPRLAQFITKYENGPQTPEPGASCTGGVGLPGA